MPGTKKPGFREAPLPVGEEARILWREIDRRLQVYASPRHGNLDDPVDELVFIILSAQTEAYLYQETFEELRKIFRSWEDLLEVPDTSISTIIQRGGLAQKKAAQIKGALRKIVDDTGSLSLDFLRYLTDVEVLRYLTSLPGIGVKSAYCIMMYSLDRHVFPVDTHVWRVYRRLGLAPPVAKPTKAQECRLEELVPAELRYRLHVNMLSHGRQTCVVYWPKCEDCVLADLCASRGKVDVVWNSWRSPRGVWAKAASTVDSDVGNRG